MDTKTTTPELTTGTLLEESAQPDKSITEQDKQRQRLLDKPTVRLFLKYYYDKNEKQTFGNRVQSYIKAFNLDPEEQYKSATVLSSRLFAKVSLSAKEYMEMTGWGLPTLIEISKRKAIETNNSKYLDTLYELGEYKSAQTNTTNIQVNIETKAEEAEEFNKEFLTFVEAR